MPPPPAAYHRKIFIHKLELSWFSHYTANYSQYSYRRYTDQHNHTFGVPGLALKFLMQGDGRTAKRLKRLNGLNGETA